MVLRYSHTRLYSCLGRIFCLIAVYSFLSANYARRMNRFGSCGDTVSPVVFLVAAVCSFISVSCSLSFYLQMCDNAKDIAKEAIAKGVVANGAVAKGAVAKEAVPREAFTYVNM